MSNTRGDCYFKKASGMRMRSILLFFLLLIPAAASAVTSDLRLENDHFILRYTDADRGLAEKLYGEAPALRDRIIADIGIDFSGKTEVRLTPTIEAFRAAQPGGDWVPLWAVGVAYPAENVIVLQSPRAVKGARIDLPVVFAHEFSHVALGRALAGVSVPVWLNEGLAIYEAREWTLSRITVLTKASLTDRLIPLRVLTRSFPAEQEPAELAYAESFMFISFLINKVGPEAFHRLIRDYIRYGDLEGALRRGTEMTLVDLEDRWLVYLNLRVSWIPIITSVSTVWFLMTLVFIYGYVRKKRQAQRRLKEMVEEEALEAPWDPDS